MVRTYFEKPHPAADHLDVLLRQMGREIQSANRRPLAVEMFASLEAGVDRHDFVEYLEHMAEETSHYVILADLAEWVAGRKLSADEARRYEIFARYEPGSNPAKAVNPLLPEASRMLEVSRALVDELGFERGNPVARLTEGGGAGAYRECARLTGDEFRERLAGAWISPRAAATTAVNACLSTSPLRTTRASLRKVWRWCRKCGRPTGAFPTTASIIALTGCASHQSRFSSHFLAYVASLSKPSINLAARLGCGLIVAPFAAAINFGGLKQVADVYRESCAKFGTKPGRLMCSYFTHFADNKVQEDAQRARQIRYYKECVIPAFPGDPKTAPPSYR